MSIQGKIEAIIYAAEEPVTLDQIGDVLRQSGLIEQLLQPTSGEDPPAAPETTAKSSDPKEAEKTLRATIRVKLREVIDHISSEYADSERAIEIKQVANGYRMATKPEHHDVVRVYAKSLKPPMRLSLQ